MGPGLVVRKQTNTFNVEVEWERKAESEQCRDALVRSHVAYRHGSLGGAYRLNATCTSKLIDAG
jgi:hypothetical protein